MLDQLATEAEELQEQLAEAKQGDTKRQEQLQKKLDELRKKMEDVAKGLQKMADQELPLEVDKPWNELLKEQAERFAKLPQRRKT